MRTHHLVTFVSLIALSTVSVGAAEPVSRSLRPVLRPAAAVTPAVASDFDIKAIAATLASEALKTGAPVPTPARSLRPRLRPAGIATASATAAPAREAAADPSGFSRWIADFRPRALSQGISATVFDRTFAEVRYLPQVVKLDRKQSEFTKSTGEYLASAVSDTRVANGREKASQHARTLDAIEAKFGVDKRVVAAIWGMESAYGSFRGSTHIPSALATLAFDGRRASFFEDQLIEALKILQHGDTVPAAMTGSWAGAMGHTQFMEDPTDALASTAAYLEKMGWERGVPWGREVVLPAGFNFTLASGPTKFPSEWARLGVQPAVGGPIPDYGPARILLPAGAKGVAFLVFRNFDVIKRYNNSDAYAIGVGHLGDRIGGAGALRGSWPAGERALKRAERQELQSLLTQAGYSTGGVDGRIGPNTVEAIRGYQKRIGMEPDGHPSVALLTRLRG